MGKEEEGDHVGRDEREEDTVDGSSEGKVCVCVRGKGAAADTK